MIIKLFLILLLCVAMPILDSRAAEKDEAPAKKVSAKQVGGLLFDVDEGVEIEQGAGGSVYMKSNREFMKNKLDQFEERIKTLEAKVAKLEASKSPASARPAAADSASADDASQNRVLIN